MKYSYHIAIMHMIHHQFLTSSAIPNLVRASSSTIKATTMDILPTATRGNFPAVTVGNHPTVTILSFCKTLLFPNYPFAIRASWVIAASYQASSSLAASCFLTAFGLLDPSLLINQATKPMLLKD